MTYYEKKELVKTIQRACVIALLIILLSIQLFAARVKDVANIEGLGGTQVIGYGLVVGLNQTGDNQVNSYTNQSVVNMLKRFGLTSDYRNSRMRNVAAVMITATIPPFMKPGSKIDVSVSSMGDASSLQGGMLLMSPLSRADGSIVGNAQGSVSVGGYNFSSLGSQVSKNFVTSGRVPNGLILSQTMTDVISADATKLRITLRDPDFTTSSRLSRAINSAQGLANSAVSIDAATVQVTLAAGQNQNQIIQTIERIESLNIDTDPIAKVVINERTGTVVVGGNVRISPTTIAHSGLEITIQKQVVVPQPAPFTIAPPRIAETASIEAKEEVNAAEALDTAGDTTVNGMVSALNSLKVKPRDLIAIFQALKEAGALQAELVIQ
jgi:flagellar P-ring protein precursor FlgI